MAKEREREYIKKRLRLHMIKQRAMTPRWQNEGQLLNDHKGKPNEMQMRGQDTETENQNDIKREKINFWPKSQNGYSASRAQTSVWRELIIADGEIHC